MSSSPLNSPVDSDPRIALTSTLVPDAAATELLEILDRHLEDLKAGRAVPRAELIARYPHLALQLDACLAGLEFIHGTENAPPERHQRLGDFRIIREVGRGGMGAVYEAEQISLRRTVALKIMRFGTVADAEAIERFKREAETVAAFHHTNIVPIFAVGVDRGVNYYAMQFIDGRSLAEVVSAGRPFPDGVQVAEWGLQACEALSHAHQRGVVHRDVKPSNLLLDGENRLWLTDFGLARKLDNVTLSVAGALVGTPRYMSPEQAAAAAKRVDHRSDIFSLGATVYELLTGVPAFRGETPIEVIQNILAADPEPVRNIVRAIPRDLETIVMKCLAKEPHQRYNSANELCFDLRAFLDSRPIRARRANFIERSARWLHRQQRSVRQAVAVAAITVTATMASIAGWIAYDASRQGSLQLTAAFSPLVVDVIDSDGELVRSETAPMQNAIRLPAGDYQVQVAAEGELSETYAVSLGAGRDLNFSLDPHDQLLWTPRNIEGNYDVFPQGDALGPVTRSPVTWGPVTGGLVTWSREGLTISKRFPPQTITVPLNPAALPSPGGAAGFAWPYSSASTDRAGYGQYDLRPWVAQKPVDVDGDGHNDLIIGGRHQAWVAAISGHSGSVLWFAPRGRDVIGPAAREDSFSASPVVSALLSDLNLDHDIDSDGLPDIVTTFAEVAPNSNPNATLPSITYWLEGISSKTGQSLWRFDIPEECFALKGNDEVPYELKWFVGQSGGAFGGNMGSGQFGRHRVRFGGWKFERRGAHGYRPASVASVAVDDKLRLGIVAGSSLLFLDPATGESDGPPFDLGVRPGQACQWGDVDGDGNNDLVMIEESLSSKSEAAVRLAAWSLAKQKVLWSKVLESSFPRMPGWSIAAPRWPILVDIEGDGKCEIIVPDGRSPDSAGVVSIGDQAPWGSLSVIQGATGDTLWKRRLVSMDRQIDYVINGPDINQDGYCEMFVATLVGTEFRTHVDALCGRTGETLWSNSFAPPSDRNTSIEYHLTPPTWWNSGENGWPTLIVRLVASGDGPERSHVGVFSAVDGHLARVGRNITALRPSDMDGDGVDDLLVFNAKSLRNLDVGGTLHCIRSVSAEPWSQLGDRGDPVADLDGDGIRDLINGWPSSQVVATSGSTGRLLWRTTIDEDGRQFQVKAAGADQPEAGDLDGDGVGDFLGWRHVSHYREHGYPFFAVSGKTGRRLWTANDVTAQILNRVLTAEAHDLDGDGKLEVIWIASLDYGFKLRNSISTNDTQLWMFVCSGQSGKLRWASPLSTAYDGTTATVMMQAAGDGHSLSPTVADIDGDGVKDILVPKLLDDGQTLETSAQSGSDGRVLWARPFPVAPNRQFSTGSWTPPAVCDLGGDGRVEVVAVETMYVDAEGRPRNSLQVVTALEGSSGMEIWKSAVETSSDAGNPTLVRNGEFTRPHVLRAEGNTSRIAVIAPGVEPAIRIFNFNGIGEQWRLSGSLNNCEIRVCDVDRDGIDELVCLDQRNLTLISASESPQAIWSQTLPTMGPCRILDIRSTADATAPIIAVAFDASDNSVVGFDAASGERRWWAAGIISRMANDNTLLVPRRMDWLNTTNSKGSLTAPYIYCSYDGVSRVRRGTLNEVALETDSLQTLRVSAPLFRPRNKLAAAQADQRWKRDLPWARTTISTQELAWNVAWLMFLAMFIIVLPILFLLRVIKRRQFSLRTLLGLPAVAGCFLLAALIDIPIAEDLSTLSERLLVAIAFTPLVLAIGVMVSWIIHRRWYRALGWLAGTVCVSAICAAVMIWIDAYHRNPLLPEEAYSSRDWPFVWLIGAYVTAWLLVISLPLERASVWFRKWIPIAIGGVRTRIRPL